MRQPATAISPAINVRPARLTALAAEQGVSLGDRGEGHADHAGGVFLADGEDCEDGDHGLSKVDSGQGELGGVLRAGAGSPGGGHVGGGGDDRADSDGECGGAGE